MPPVSVAARPELVLDGSLSDGHLTPRYVLRDLIFVLHFCLFFKSNLFVLVLAAVTILDLAVFSPHFWRQSRCQSLSWGYGWP